MKKQTTNCPELTMAQIEVDIIMANKAIDEAKCRTGRLSKYFKGQAGYHLQQAAEKLIKIQIYNSAQKVDNSKVFKHDISQLVSYAKTIGVKLIVPSYIITQGPRLTSWEAEGRYDVHVVVRIDTLEKCYEEVISWMEDVKKNL